MERRVSSWLAKSSSSCLGSYGMQQRMREWQVKAAHAPAPQDHQHEAIEHVAESAHGFKAP